jgi:hypothetical protein
MALLSVSMDVTQGGQRSAAAAIARTRGGGGRRRNVPCGIEPRVSHRPRDLARLLALASTGDQDAFGRFYDATSQTVFGMVLVVVPDRARAEILAEAVYVSAWRLAPTYDADRQTPHVWLAGIVGAESSAANGRPGSCADD